MVFIFNTAPPKTRSTRVYRINVRSLRVFGANLGLNQIDFFNKYRI